MDGINRIQEQILADARLRAQEQEKKAEAYRLELLQEAEAEGAALRAEAEAELALEGEQLMARTRSYAETKSRTENLRVRQEAVQEALERALAVLGQRPAADRLSFLETLVKQSRVEAGTVRLSEADLDLRADLQRELGSAFTVSETAAAISGGLLLEGEEVVENLSFDLLLRNRRAELTAWAAALLAD